MNFRDLRADEIECRVANVTPKGISLLLYKNARCDMNVLDETVGAENWQREHYECKGNLFCRVGINTNYEHPELPDRWIWKADCGAESYTEKEKGEASDSFKRSCFCWNIGRELYTAPFIWIKSDMYETYEKNGKTQVKDNFYVRSIIIEDKKIVALEIARSKDNIVVFTTGDDELKKKCRISIEALKEVSGRTEEELYAEAKKRAKSSDLRQIYTILGTMLREANE